MAMSFIVIETVADVLFVTLNRPEVLNAFHPPMLDELRQALDQARNDPRARAVVLQGAGRAFCAGDDIKALSPLGGPEAEILGDLRARQHTLLRQLRECPKPTVAAIHGYAVGFGLDLALACDFRLAAEDARVGDGRLARAIPLSTGSTYLLPQLVGLSCALDLLLTGRLVDGLEAQSMGLVGRTVAAQSLPQAAAELARTLAQGPTKLLGIVKQQVYEELSMNLAQALEHALQFRLVPIADAEEGLRSFIEKRQPRFTGK